MKLVSPSGSKGNLQKHEIVKIVPLVLLLWLVAFTYFSVWKKRSHKMSAFNETFDA